MANVNTIAPNDLYWTYDSSRAVNNNLGQDQFLQLLVAQLQYQDPLEPVKDSDFVAQLAQFSSLEQLQSMSKSMSFSQAYGLVGKVVVAEANIDGVLTQIPGVVDGVVMKDGEAYAQIGDYLVKVSTITQVYDNSLFSIDQSLMSASGLIGRTVTAVVTNTVKEEETKTVDGKETTVTVEKQVPTSHTGVVTGVAIEKGELIATIQTGTDDDGKPTFIKAPVASIVDIRMTGAAEAADSEDDSDDSDTTGNPNGTIIVTDDDGTSGGNTTAPGGETETNVGGGTIVTP